MFGKLGTLPQSVYEEFHNLTGIEIDDRKDKMTIVALELEKWIVNMVKFARRLPGFSELSQADQITLLKGNIFCLYDKVIIRKDRIK